MTFPGLLNFLPPEIPPGPPGVDCGVSQMVLGSNDSQINPHRCAKFGRGPTVVGGGGYRQIDRHTHRQRDAAVLYSRL